jgi:hypothetical protein
MKTLSQEAQARARAFIYEHARPLEQAIFAYEFEGGSVAAVLQELAESRNSDGGFGHALEPDIRLPDSSVIATTVGLQVLRRFDAGADHPLVVGAMRYLMATYDADRKVWPIIPPKVDDAPHAPWWNWSEDLAEGWGGFLVNPRAEIVGYLHDYAELAPESLREELTAAVVNYLDDHADRIGMFDVLCYVRLAESDGLPPDVKEALIAGLDPVVDQLVVKDPDQWENYVLTPLEVVEGPASPFADLLADILPANLDFEIEHQAESGAWEPKWTWGGLHPEAWAQAKKDWSGVLTVRALTTLRNFGRLEGEGNAA